MYSACPTIRNVRLKDCIRMVLPALLAGSVFAKTPNADAPTTKAGLEAAGYTLKESKFGEFTQYEFAMEGVRCFVVVPKKPVAGNPWLWRARFWGHEPQFDRAMLKRGWHVCYCHISGLFGSDKAVARWDRFYALTRSLSLHPEPVLEGMSRGGLIVMRWATAHPDQVAGIYLDNAVMDIRSWPGGKGIGKGAPGEWKKCLAAYELTEKESEHFKEGPLHGLAALARANISIYALMNLDDRVVPPAENGELLVKKYQALGGPIRAHRRPGLGHHPHSLKDPAPLVAFALKALKNSNFPVGN